MDQNEAKKRFTNGPTGLRMDQLVHEWTSPGRSPPRNAGEGESGEAAKPHQEGRSDDPKIQYSEDFNYIIDLGGNKKALLVFVSCMSPQKIEGGTCLL